MILTNRERELVQLFSSGKTTRQAADEMKLSMRTIESHSLNVLRKLGLHSRLEVVALAKKKGWLN